ncbi:MAG: Ku protein [Microthrixaceae bacterium]|nr:Ku protein [Microthrixaceae bacterium]
MPRAIWHGSISFGLVSIPVRLFPATSRKTVRFNQIDTRTGSRVRQKRVSEADGSEVPMEDIAKGYELSSGRYVVITDYELAALDPEASRTIELLEFVDQASINPIVYDSAYFLAPDEANVKPYALLLRALTEADKVGIARFVMRGKEYLATIRPDHDKLVLSTMLYADEIRGVEDIPGLDVVARTEVNDKEVAMANQLIASLDAEFDSAAFEDSYRQKVLDLIERKAAGESGLVELPTPREENKVIDIMAALEASVAAAKAARANQGVGAVANADADAEADDVGDGDGSGSDARPEAATKKAPARKVAAKKATPRARKSA